MTDVVQVKGYFPEFLARKGIDLQASDPPKIFPPKFFPPKGADVDDINHPPHYTHGRIEPIDVIEDWGLGYHDGNAIKYIARARHKGHPAKDYRKAAWYLTRLATELEEKRQ